MIETYVVHVTRACNADCKYCYERDSDRTIKYSTEEIENYCSTLLDNRTSNEFNIEFIGGEPMLAVENMIAAYNLIEEKAPHEVVNYFITTNGIYLPDKALEFIQSDKRVKWAVSIDGNQFANSLRVDKFGKNLLDRSLASFKKLKEAGIQDEQISVHLVTHPYNVYLLENSISFLYEQGFRHIGVGVIEKTMEIGKEFSDRFIQEFSKVSKKIHNNELPDAHIDLLSHIKPRQDRRFYIRDKNGKLLGESYGRSGDDITNSNEFDPVEGRSNLTDFIPILKEIVYYRHVEGIYD